MHPQSHRLDLFLASGERPFDADVNELVGMELSGRWGCY